MATSALKLIATVEQLWQNFLQLIFSHLLFENYLIIKRNKYHTISKINQVYEVIILFVLRVA